MTTHLPDNAFRLATVRAAGSPPFVVLVIDDAAVALDMAAAACPGAGLHAAGGIYELLQDWPRNFDALQEIAAAVRAEGLASDRWGAAAGSLDRLTFLPPVLRPGKMLYAAANQPAHITEMISATNLSGDMAKAAADRDKSRVRPYCFLKAPSTLAGAFDDIVLPSDVEMLDWEVEIAVAIGRAAKRVPAERALDHVAGFMTTNDLTSRDGQMRPDWQQFRIDWFTGKSHDGFAPMGPFFVPAAFVPDYGGLRMTLKVNGELKQDGMTGEMVFSVEEQIAHGSKTLTFLPGDILAAGTPGGVGHASGTYLVPGDIVEAEVETLGAQRAHVVAEA
ncbi:MAG: fumarylacetoacetate hydrolase family protein [Alphaproteobacteria bacterium]|jgi:2,4-diketo-3-deoxy-L-fuconate hydrolase